MLEDKVRVYVPFVRVDPEERSLGSPKFFVPCSPLVRVHGLDFNLNLDKMIRHSGGGVRNTVANMNGSGGGHFLSNLTWHERYPFIYFRCSRQMLEASRNALAGYIQSICTRYAMPPDLCKTRVTYVTIFGDPWCSS